jgi:hypothetical protein
VWRQAAIGVAKLLNNKHFLCKAAAAMKGSLHLFGSMGMADDIAGQLITVTKIILAQHPELADKYVVIRNDVIRGREEILPTAK